MKTGILLIVLTFALTFTAHAAEDRRDGNWWATLPQVGKALYIGGIFDGLAMGRDLAIGGWHNGDKSNAPDCESDAIKSFVSFSARYFGENVTSGQFVDGLDAFFKDFRNRSILVSDAIWVVSNQIAGTPQEKIDTLIENYRKTAPYLK